MIALKALVVLAAAASLIAPAGRPGESIVWAHTAAQVAPARHDKAPRLPRMRVVQMGARIHVRVTTAL